jgi:hypothetical protein
VFKPPTSIFNPGPGSYYKEKKWNDRHSLSKILEKYDSHQHQDLVVKPVGRTPSIPAKKVAPNAYSGLG